VATILVLRRPSPTVTLLGMRDHLIPQQPGGLVPLHDFTLPDADGGELSFDAAFRAERNALLFFYRGHW